ncbi:hypothetical protein VNO77_04081 [Canavalia gladiata]|uniref:Uncharacterized protein n=1 Tax=Canavalia gladiata TaxID=3824 RepID=A0AAN9R8R0_CANGL
MEVLACPEDEGSLFPDPIMAHMPKRNAFFSWTLVGQSFRSWGVPTHMALQPSNYIIHVRPLLVVNVSPSSHGSCMAFLDHFFPFSNSRGAERFSSTKGSLGLIADSRRRQIIDYTQQRREFILSLSLIHLHLLLI